jgi:hypothetical protein
MHKAKNGKKENKKKIKSNNENESNNEEESKTREISIQTEEGENIYKNAEKIFLIKSKKEKLDSVILSKYIPIIFLMLISFYLYKKSLKGCDLEESVCLEAANIKKFYKYGYKLLLCSFIVGFILLLIFYGLISVLLQIPFISVYIYFFYSYQGVDLRNHGIYNSFMLTIISFFIFLVYLYLYTLFKSIYKHKIKKATFFILSLAIPLISLYYFYIQIECNRFYHGLNNIEISQKESENLCFFPKPKFCTIKIFDNILDLSKITYLIKKGIPPLPYITNYFYDSDNYCQNRDNSKEIFYKHANRKKRLKKYGLDLAYPDTSIFDFRKHARVGKFHYKVFNRIYDYNKRLKKYKNSLNRKKRANPEVIVHFKNDSDHGELTMDLRQDKKLIYKRRKESAKFKVRYDNILFIFIDAVSKNHFRRKFPLSSNLLSNYLVTNNENNNNEGNNINAYQFLKYNNFRPSTQVNVLPMFYGESMKSQKGSSLIKYFKEKGYITGGSENICHKELFLLEQDKNKDVIFESFDHENFAMFCDPNYNPPNNRVSLFKGLFSMMRRCLYNKETFEWVFEFGYKFLEAYKNERKFLRLGFIDGHEGTMEAIKYLDKHLYKFLQFYIQNYFSNSTAIIIASDHGENMISVHHLLNSDEFLYERTLGTLFILLPKFYEKPKKIVDFGANLEIIDNEEEDEDDDEEENEDSTFDWSGMSDYSFGWGRYARDKTKLGYNIDRDYYRLTKKDTCLFGDLYSNIHNNRNNKNKLNKKKNNNIKDKNENENKNENTFNLLGTTKELQIYQNIQEFNEKYYLNSNKNKYIKDDYSYDVERIVFDDDKEFYLPYNKTALFINQQRFVTPYDIHDTMVYFVSNDYYWKSKKGQSLTDEINGLKRNCEIYMDDFDNETIKEYCRCIPFQ